MISSTQEALTALSVTNDVLTKEQKTRLKEDGYCLISITPQEWKDRGIYLDQISRVVDELIAKEGWKGGWDHIKEKMVEGCIQYKDHQIILLVIPLLFEAKFEDICTEIWLVKCPKEVQKRSLKKKLKESP